MSEKTKTFVLNLKYTFYFLIKYSMHAFFMSVASLAIFPIAKTESPCADLISSFILRNRIFTAALFCSVRILYIMFMPLATMYYCINFV